VLRRHKRGLPALQRDLRACGPPFLILASVLYALAFVLFPPPAPRRPPPEEAVEARDLGEVDEAAVRSRAPWISFELLAALMSPEDAAGLEWSPVETLEDPRNYFHSPSDDVLHDTVVLRYGLLRNGTWRTSRRTTSRRGAATSRGWVTTTPRGRR